MATLLAVYNSDGCVGRCDAKCYNAQNPQCVCICGGANHGVGRSQAIQNTVEMVEGQMEDLGLSDQLEAFKEAHGLNGNDQYQVVMNDLQPALPGFGEKR